MTTVRIDFPDDQVAMLAAKAAAQGLSLEDWLRSLATREARPPKGRYTLAELVKQCDLEVPLSEEDRQWIETPPVGRESL
jgi:hypothetical protein